MKRLTRQRRSENHKPLRPVILWSSFILGGGILFVTLLLLERGARLDVPALPDDGAGQFVFYSTLKKPGSGPAEKMIPAEVHEEPEPPFPPDRKIEEIPVGKTEIPAPTPIRRKIYSIQVAASKDKASAEIMVRRLKQKGYAAFLVHELVPNKGNWYRVRVGPYEDRDEARKASDRLSEREQLSGFLVIDNQGNL